MLRLSHPDLARRGAEIFERVLTHCRRIDSESWRTARTFLERCKSRLAHFVLARLDPMVAQWQWRWRGAEKEKR
jgi:hypothetical protein